MSLSPTESSLADSVSSLSSRTHGGKKGRKRRPSPVAIAFKESREFFLTRRLVEAFDVLEPITASSKGSEIDHDESSRSQTDQPPPIAVVEAKDRIRIWNLYIMIIHAAIELGPDAGRSQFGSARWKSLAAKARDGTVWDEVVSVGYGGVEGRVDAEVVSNMSAYSNLLSLAIAEPVA